MTPKELKRLVSYPENAHLCGQQNFTGAFLWKNNTGTIPGLYY
jgi:hypothetical protein